MLQQSLSSHYDPHRIATVPAVRHADPVSGQDVAVLTVRAISGCLADMLTLDLAGTDYVRVGGDLYADGVRIGCVAGGDGTALRLTLTAQRHADALLATVRYANQSPGAPYSRAFLLTSSCPGRVVTTMRREAVNAAWLPMLARQVATALADLAARGNTAVDTSGRLRPPAAAAPSLSIDHEDAATLLMAFELVQSATPLARKGVEAAPRLSPRQREVLHLVADGRSNKRIAIDLGVSPATIKTHVASAIAAIGAQNRTDAAMKARERGWI